MPTLELFGHRDPVELVEYDLDGSCTVRLPSGATLTTRVANLSFEKGEAIPAASVVRGLTHRQRVYLQALLKRRDDGGLTDAEHKPINGLSKHEACAARQQLAPLRPALIRCGPVKQGVLWRWEITVAGEHALAGADRAVESIGRN